MNSTNKNFLLNLIYQLFIFIIPLITVPYVSRVLGANNIGIYSYTYSIITYFMLGTMLGINNYGSREIAKVSDNIEKKSKKFFSIYYLQLISNLVMIVLFLIFQLLYRYKYNNILLIQILYLISCGFDINWYFFGVEKFKITVSRNIIIKFLSLILIFIFVKSKNDLWIYTLILSGSTLISQLYLWLYMKKEVIFTKIKFSEAFSHLSKCLILFIPVIAYSVYRIMDKTMIGAISNTVQLGNYENAERIINIPLSIITALGTVMLPHMSKSNEQDFDEKVTDTFKLCYFMLFPIFIGVLITAKEISDVLFGNEFLYAANIIRFLIITILFSGLTNIIRNNYLIPKSKDSIYVKSTIYGAIVNLILNLIFIKMYGAYGACIGTVTAEFIVMLYQFIKTRNVIKYKYEFKCIFPFFIKSIITGFFIFIVLLLKIDNCVIRLIIQIIIGLIIYVLLNKNYILYEFFGIKHTK